MKAIPLRHPQLLNPPSICPQSRQHEGCRRSGDHARREKWLTHQRIPGHAELAYVIAITNRDKDAAIRSRPRTARVPDELRDYFAKRGEWLIPERTRRTSSTPFTGRTPGCGGICRSGRRHRTNCERVREPDLRGDRQPERGGQEALGDTLETAQGHHLTQLQPTGGAVTGVPGTRETR